jgi:hypothetical protein
MRPPLFAEANTIEKVHFAKHAWNSRDAVTGERCAADAERDIRGFELGCRRQQVPRTVDGSHDELSARSMR